MTRQDVKVAIANVIQTVTSVKTVMTYRSKLAQQAQLPMVTVLLPRSKETRLTQSAPNGKKIVQFTAQLEIVTVDVSADGSGQLTFDDVLDAIDAALRANPTLNGSVLASTVEFITTAVGEPYLVNGQTVGLAAIKQFDVSVQVTG